VNLLGDNIDTIKKNTQTLIDASKKDGLQINIKKTKYMLLSRNQNHDIKIANKSFENAANFRYLETIVTNQILIQVEIKSRWNSGNACYHLVQNFCRIICCLKS
jgi:hypothetical protein